MTTIPDEPIAQLKYLLELYRTGSIVSVEAMYCIVALLKYALDLVIKNRQQPDNIWSEGTPEAEFLGAAAEFIEEMTDSTRFSTAGAPAGSWLAKQLIQILIQIMIDQFSKDGVAGLRQLANDVEDL